MAPALRHLAQLVPRQCYGADNCVGPPESNVDYALRYAIVGAIVVAILAYIGIGMAHANYRVKHGKEPLFYHRCLLPPRSAARMQSRTTHVGPAPRYYPRNRYGNEYMMQEWQQNFPAPPPIYSPSDGPPKYFAPDGPPPGHAQGPQAATMTSAGAQLPEAERPKTGVTVAENPFAGEASSTERERTEATVTTEQAHAGSAETQATTRHPETRNA